MKERYIRLCLLEENQYLEDAPILIRKGALLKDTVTGQLLCQLKFKNLSSKKIKMIKVSVSCLDSVNRLLGEEIEYQYLDMDLPQYGEGGDRNPNLIPNVATRSVEVRVKEVAFEDNTLWQTESQEKWKPLPKQEPIETWLSDENALAKYRSLFGESACNIPLKHNNFWICTCGEINLQEQQSCHSCGAFWDRQTNVDAEALRKDHIYDKAQELCENGNVNDLERAVQLYTSIDDWKDSKEQIENLQEKIKVIKKKTKRTKRIAVFGVSAVVFVALTVLASYFVIYPLRLKASGDYKTYIEKFDVKEFEIPKGVTKIEDYAFEGCDDLVRIKIPESVTSIGDNAFSGCTSLTTIIIPESVTSIGERAFKDCTSLSDITISNGVENIGGWAFCGCTSLRNITIPDSVTSIGGGIFDGCTRLSKISLPFIGSTPTNGIPLAYVFGLRSYYEHERLPTSLKTIVITGGTTICGFAFDGCSNLTSITIGGNVKSISDYAFKDCTSLKSITIHDSVTSIGYAAFRGCTNLTSIIVPDSVTFIKAFAFEGCTSLTNITIPDSVTSIEQSVFRDCTRLESITIPDSVTSIGYDEFRGCTSLTSITIPNSVTSIGSSAFEYCSRLTRVYYGGTAEDWENINIGSYNENLTSATRYYYSETQPTTTGNYWRYVNGVPTPW